GPFGGNGKESADLRRRTFENVRAPKMERKSGKLETYSDQYEQTGENNDGVHTCPCRIHSLPKQERVTLGDVGEIARPKFPGQKANAIKHDAGGAAAINHIFQGGLAALAFPL